MSAQLQFFSIAGSLVLSAAAGAAISHYYSARRRLSYMVRERRVLDPVDGMFPPEVKISFFGKDVSTLSEWKIFVWNRGNQTISRDDLVDGSLALKLCNLNIVGTAIASANRESISPLVRSIDAHVLELSFSYLDKGDSVGLTVYTDRPRDTEDYSVLLDGYIKGMPKGMRREAAVRISSARKTKFLFAIPPISLIFAYVSIYMLVNMGELLGIWDNFPDVSRQDIPKFLGYVSMGESMIIIMACILLCYWACVLLVEKFGVIPPFVRKNLK